MKCFFFQMSKKEDTDDTKTQILSLELLQVNFMNLIYIRMFGVFG